VTSRDGPAPALTPQELTGLRRAHLDAEETALRARLAQVALRRLLLSLEEAHGLALADAEVDLRTGEISTPAANGDASHSPTSAPARE